MLRQRHYFANKGLSSQRYDFSNSYVWMWELDHTGIWAPKSWCFWIEVLEKILESPLDCKEMKLDNSKGNQSWLLEDWCWSWNSNTGHLMQNLLIGKDPIAWKHWRQEENGMTEEEMVGWHHQWTWVWASSWSWWWTGKSGVLQSMGLQRIDTTEWMNWTELSNKLRVISIQVVLKIHFEK